MCVCVSVCVCACVRVCVCLRVCECVYVGRDISLLCCWAIWYQPPHPPPPVHFLAPPSSRDPKRWNLLTQFVTPSGTCRIEKLATFWPPFFAGQKFAKPQIDCEFNMFSVHTHTHAHTTRTLLERTSSSMLDHIWSYV